MPPDKKGLALGIAIVLAVAAQGCSASTRVRSAPRIPPSGDATIAYPQEPLSFNPYLFEGDSTATRDLLRPVLPTLLSIDPSLRYRPSLATRVPSGKDLTTAPFSVTFHLDRRAVWSDGAPLTADDVIFTWHLIKDPRWPVRNRSRYRHIAAVVAPDSNSVRIEFDQPYKPWKDLFSAGDFILPKHVLEGKDFSRELSNGIDVSAGPYQIDKWTKGLEVTYKPNPRWWGATGRRSTRPARVSVKFVPDIEIALRLLATDQVQVLVSSTRLNLGSRLRGLGGVSVKSRYGADWWQLVFNHSHSVTAASQTRQGIARSINRQELVEAFIGSDGRRLERLRPHANLSDAFRDLTLDSTRAAAMLRQAQGRQVILAVPGQDPMAGSLAGAIQKEISAAGLVVETRGPDTDEFYGQWRKDGRFDLAIWEERSSPEESPSPHLLSHAAAPDGANYSREVSAALDEVLEKTDRFGTDDAAAGSSLAGTLADELPVLPLFEAKAYIAFHQSMTGPDPNASVDGAFWNLDSWWRSN